MPAGAAGDQNAALLEQDFEALLEPGRLDVEKSAKKQRSVFSGC
jgi:hypothetical protein